VDLARAEAVEARILAHDLRDAIHATLVYTIHATLFIKRESHAVEQ
jgi:hypothetical protein